MLFKDHSGCPLERRVSKGTREGGRGRRARGGVRLWEPRQEILMALAGEKQSLNPGLLILPQAPLPLEYLIFLLWGLLLGLCPELAVVS